ncbi:MAG: lipoyl synthase [Candidatus Fischerbacteria bacterium RBG_13_37_8]|uniref:Lipoyl synthase n=1 Tax=Candidatus Fischerbacteria bacterium RBG_13_37_8 TaxID=1817863 RepID=A0A1F5V4P7_9BACT|nr:MAG: lipoyl synthase [Candidatus Fischerbacteria bacterium RBG_13_37_8]
MNSTKKHPKWLKVKLATGKDYFALKREMKKLNLHTVCEEARCPNIGECWNKGIATVMILGDVCTRNCHFCAVRMGNPGGEIDRNEPTKVAEIVRFMKLRYVVITSVDRDDLEDSGAMQFYQTVLAIRNSAPEVKIEVLIPDFRGDTKALDLVISSNPDVISHNIETVRRLVPVVRDKRASYECSLNVLSYVKEKAPHILTKSGLMIGLGETMEDIIRSMADLRECGCQIITIGQYLQPTKDHVPIREYIHPEVFNSLKEIGISMGFLLVESNPLVRSSYMAHMPETGTGE